MLPTLVKQGVQTVAKNADALKQIRQIILKNVPRTATSTDIRRVINKAGVRGVSDIAIDYEYFKPAERAILTLVSADYLKPNLRALANLSISGIPVQAQPHVAEAQSRSRMRGHAGRVEAALRGTLLGNGSHAGIANNELTVTLGGLPAQTSTEYLAGVLKDFKVAKTMKGHPQIVKLPLCLFSDVQVFGDLDFDNGGSPLSAEAARIIPEAIRRGYPYNS